MTADTGDGMKYNLFINGMENQIELAPDEDIAALTRNLELAASNGGVVKIQAPIRNLLASSAEITLQPKHWGWWAIAGYYPAELHEFDGAGLDL